jgi:hypothetical protein
LTKNVWAKFWAIFFTDTSGHSDHWSPAKKDSQKVARCEAKTCKLKTALMIDEKKNCKQFHHLCTSHESIGHICKMFVFNIVVFSFEHF